MFKTLASIAFAVATVSLSAVSGSQALVVSGVAAHPLQAVHVQLSAHFSDDLPDVALNRYDTTAGADGRYRIEVQISPAGHGATVIAAVWQDGQPPVKTSYKLPGDEL